MKPSETVVRLALQGRKFIPIGRQGKFWTVCQRPWFHGKALYDLELTEPCTDWTPFAAQWTIDASQEPPMLYRATTGGTQP